MNEKYEKDAEFKRKREQYEHSRNPLLNFWIDTILSFFMFFLLYFSFPCICQVFFIWFNDLLSQISIWIYIATYLFSAIATSLLVYLLLKSYKFVYLKVKQLNLCHFQDHPKAILLKILFYGLWSTFLLAFTSLALYYTITEKRLTDIIPLAIFGALALAIVIREIVQYHKMYQPAFFGDTFPCHKVPHDSLY